MSLVFNMVGGGGGIKLTGIAITTPPTKTTYTQGESFDAAGMVVTATYSNGATLKCTGYTVEPSGALADGMTAVMVYYTEGGVTKTAEQAIAVIHRLTGIEITAQPTKTTYEYGDNFQSSGMTVQATYSDGATAAVTGYACSPATLNTVGTQTITVSYTERSVTKTATTSVTVNRKTISTVPSQSGTLTYTGSGQSPTWNHYSTTQLTIGGTTSGTNAGSYTATFTPTANYRWSDGTTTAKSVTWSISKAAGSLSISPTSMTLDTTTKSKTITVTRSGNGTITATSSNTAAATVSVSGTTVTVTGVANGSATITVSVAAGTNYTAPASKTCAVTASFKPTASTTATSGVTYTSGLSGVAATDVTLFAEAISNNSNIANATSTVYIDFGSVHRKVSVGDQVTLALDGTDYTFDVIGFNHDTLTTSTAYGATTTTGKAGITFQMHDCFATTYVMNSSDTNSGGWTSCAMRQKHLPAILKLMPSEVQAGIREVNKLTSAGSQRITINTTADKLFLLSEIEIFGSASQSMSGEGTQYAYYKAGNSTVKNRGGSADSWWERSPHLGYSDVFCRVTSGGIAYSNSANYYNGVAFGFCV